MKRIVDKRRSKREILEPDEMDLRRLEERQMRVEAEIKKLDAMVTARRITEEYRDIIIESHKRLAEIAHKRMRHDVKDVAWHASVVGQYNERLKITQEMLTLASRKKSCKNRLDIIKRAVLKLRRSFGKQQEDETDNAT